MSMFTPEKIRALRKAMGLNTTEFAVRFGVTTNTVARWENGDRHPRYEQQIKMNEMEQALLKKDGKALAKAQ